MEVVAEYVTEDTAWDGHGDGPGYAAAVGQALEDARLGRIDVLLVWALDRLSRHGIEATLSLMRQFSAHGTDVWSLRESWTETSDPHVRQLITAIMAWVAGAAPTSARGRREAGEEQATRSGTQPAGGDTSPPCAGRCLVRASTARNRDEAEQGAAGAAGRHTHERPARLSPCHPQGTGSRRTR